MQASNVIVCLISLRCWSGDFSPGDKEMEHGVSVVIYLGQRGHFVTVERIFGAFECRRQLISYSIRSSIRSSNRIQLFGNFKLVFRNSKLWGCGQAYLNWKEWRSKVTLTKTIWFWKPDMVSVATVISCVFFTFVYVSRWTPMCSFSTQQPCLPSVGTVGRVREEQKL